MLAHVADRIHHVLDSQSSSLILDVRNTQYNNRFLQKLTNVAALGGPFQF